MKKKYIWMILAAIMVLAIVFRLWQLGNIPPSPDWDEAAIGYDAYSIIHTGRDQFGKLFPLVVRSLDDYKPALYIYLAIPSILFLGLNTFAVRLPSAIFGILSVFAVYYLVKELFEKYKYRDHLSLLSSFLLAISPWSIQFSRIGFESNVGNAFNIFAAVFFLKGFKKPWLLSLSAVCAGLSLYIYQTEKIFTPLLMLALAMIYRKRLLSVGRKYLVVSFVFGVLIVMPMLMFIVTDKASLARIKKTSIFTAQTEILKINLQKLNRDREKNDRAGMIFDNRRVEYAKTIVGGYLSHFDLNWLFLKGDNERHHAPNMGLMYLFELPFLLYGIYLLMFFEVDKKAKLFILSWILIAPFPASFTTGLPHAVRTLNFIPMLQIISALGILSMFIYVVKYRNLKYLFYIVFAGIFLLNFTYYMDQYFVQLNYYDSSYWQYGYKQAVDEVNLIGNKYGKIVVSNDKSLDKSYIFFLFYLKYPPLEYQKISKFIPEDAINNSFGKYEFRPIDWKKDASIKNVLYIANPSEIPDGVSTRKTIHNLDGTPAIKVVGT